MEQEWIQIYEYIKSKDENKNWLIKILEEDSIPYKAEMESYWDGTYKQPKYNEKIIIYVPKQFKVKVEEYIKDFNNPKNLITEDIEELKNINNEELEQQEELINKRQNKMRKWLAIIILGMICIPILLSFLIK